MQTKLYIRYFTLTVVYLLVINNCYSKTSPIDSTTPDSSDYPVITKVLPASKNGPEKKVEYAAEDSIELDNAKQILYLYGLAKVTYGDMVIEADKIIIHLESNEVHAFAKTDSLGKVIEKVKFKDAEQFFLAPRIDYNFKTQKGKIIEIYTQEGELHLHAEKAKKMPDNSIFVRRGKITTCDHEDPHFYFSASKLKMIPGKVMVAGPTHLVIRDLHTPIWLPFGIFPNNAEKQSGIIIPSQGSNNGKAGISDFGFHWAMNDYLHLEFLGSVLFGGTFLSSVNAQYKKKYKYGGSLGLKYNNTIKGIPGTLGHSIQKDYNLNWQHTQDPKAHPKSRFTVGINAKTGSFNQTQLISHSNASSFVQGANNSQLGWSWTEGWGNLSINSRMDQNFTTSTISITAPSLNLNVRNQKIYKSLQISGNLSLQNSISVADSLFNQQWKDVMKNGLKASTTIDIGRSFSIPLPVLKYFKFSMPSFTINGYANSKFITKDIVSDTIQTNVIRKVKGSYDFRWGNFGVNTKIYGLYRMKQHFLVNAFRHTITPSVTMSYTPDFYIDKQDVNRSYVDPTTGETVDYSIYENKNYSIHSPTAAKSWRMSYSLRNNLQAKVRSRSDTTNTYKKVNLINNFDLSGSYDFLAEQFKWSDFSLNFSTNPGFLKNLNASATFTPYDVDSIGTKINTLLWDKQKQVGRLTNLRVQTIIALKRKMFNNTNSRSNAAASIFDWNMNVSYTFNYRQTGITDPTIDNTVQLSGSVVLSKNWNFSYSAPLKIQELTLDPLQTNISIVRKLHCWEMLITWFPLHEANTAQYTLTIRPKSGILADLKYEKKRSSGTSTF